MIRKLAKGISYINPNPSAKQLEEAMAKGRKPEIHIEAGVEVDLDKLPVDVAAHLMAQHADEAFEPLPAPDEVAELDLEHAEEAPALDEARET